MSLREIFTFRTVCATFVAANGIVMYSNYRKLRKHRPEYKNAPPPDEKHRIAIFDNIAPTYDMLYTAMHSKLGLTAAKARMLKHAKGHVLEVAAGTLENHRLYGAISSLTAVDRSLAMCLEMRRKIERDMPPFPVTIICGDAASLPFEDESFNTVVSTHALCSVENPEACLAEIARVLKPSARYFALERGRVYYRPLRALLELMKVYPNPAIPWTYGHFEHRDPVALVKGCEALKITDFAVFGYGMNYSIVARRSDCDKVSDFANTPIPKDGARVVYQYVPACAS
ncbi:hypothetical protein X943_003977 [Babesia divergens]|uniref:Methyltransferase type 11 domain-containing protein n=1 Tax=Babesia divergens TaxID=32595 RepID=A0AAD9LI96_BABDI|nr:hypothetical protein X943_003977 [Babesia divergens]